MGRQAGFADHKRPRMSRWIAILVTGNSVSRIGDFVYIVSLNLYVLEVTHSAFAVAGVWIVPLLAQLLIGGWVGSLTDRLPLRAALIVVEMSRAGVVLLLPLVPVSWIYPLIFLLGLGSTVFTRLFLPYVTRLVIPKQRKSVNSLMSLFQSGAIVLGPALAGALMQLGPVTYALWFDAASFIISGMSFFMLPSTLQENPLIPDTADIKIRHTPWNTLRVDWRKAVQFLGENWLFTALFIANSAGLVFGQAADSQEVVYAEEALHLGRFGYGMMVLAAGIGFVLGSLALAVFSRFIPTRLLIASGGIMVGIGYFIYAVAHGFWQAVIGLIVLGLFMAAGGIGFNTYMQYALPVDLMGRINNVLDPPQQASALVMMLVSGVVTEHFGVRTLMIGMTCIMIIIGIFNTVVTLQGRHRHALESESL